MKYVVNSKMSSKREIDWSDLEYADEDGFDLLDYINDNLIDINDNNFIQKLREIFNSQLETIQFIDIYEYGYGDWRNEKDHNFYIEFVVEMNDNYDKEELQWLSDELFDSCWEDSMGIIGVRITPSYHSEIIKIEEAK